MTQKIVPHIAIITIVSSLYSVSVILHQYILHLYLNYCIFFNIQGVVV